MSSLVELQCALFVTARRDRNDGAQRHALEGSAAVGTQEQSAARVILVGDDIDLRPRAQGQVAQEMARGERGYEQIFRIVGAGVAAKHRVGASGEIGLAVDLETILATICSIRSSASAEVPVP